MVPKTVKAEITYTYNLAVVIISNIRYPPVNKGQPTSTSLRLLKDSSYPSTSASAVLFNSFAQGVNIFF